ncbi:tetratricopeptide repeat protein 5-like isoform X2 [Rhodnius prolixus]|uniref:tetratricopeptide repeat protein 5-like isoform X2 n=1 Tax=Rhodnius prolixus TaxID=13249 RepID=UPI003D18D25A
MASALPFLDNENPDIAEIELLVDELVNYKEEFRCKHDEIVRRGHALEQIMLLHQEKLIAEDKLVYWLKLGQLYSMTKKDKQPAIDALSKVVKLDPSMPDAWNTMAECYWQGGDYDMAQKCLENSLKQVRCRVPLRNLSVICRKLALKYPDRTPLFLQAGIDLAKEAVDKDVKDGISWGILGNAYLSAYFNLNNDVTCAKLALSAYKQAVKLSTTNNAELFYNQAFANKYCEIYEDALIALDNAIALENDWEQAIKLRIELLSFLNKVQYFHSSLGKQKPKRLAKLQKDLQNLQIAPFMKSLKAEPISVGSLQIGENHKVFIYGKVIWSSPQENSFPFTCGCLEATGLIFVITIYNLTPGKGFLIGDTVFVPHPNYKMVNFHYKGKLYKFPSLRVDNPTVLIVNKKRLTMDYFTPYAMNTSEKEDA